MFLDDMDIKMRIKALDSIEILEEKGNELHEPYSKYIRQGLHELRIQSSGDIARIFFFFQIGKRIILTNGFIKKKTKTPESEITLALKYKTEYERRFYR